MNEILIVFRHNIRRAISKKNYILLTILLTFISISLAIFFTSKFEMKGNIAYVTKEGKGHIKIEGFNIKNTNQIPSMSEFVMKKYDAAVIPKENGQIEVKTLKEDDFKEKVEMAFQQKSIGSFHQDKVRKVGTNILGYLCMFVLLESIMFMSFFTEDKENRTFTRIVSSPIRISNYLFAQYLFTFLIVYAPTFLILIVEKVMFQMDIGFSFLEYSYLLAILVMIATSFSLFMSTIIETTDNTMMLSSSIIVFTTILSGAFFVLKDKNGIVDWFVRILPQKQYLSFIDGVENGYNLAQYGGAITYISFTILLFFMLSIIICEKRVQEGRY
ncbi:ABC transporter permease [Bacillus sp. 123MFChir2]|uniref:ABC transporter permease n=1 Tax=Bacillus sp. 123MFChir2 TaxID=1169144 RepID=UPI00037A64D6|nr:ABC transporter permease [Bacillus sp. 123MFChir2]